ncbi:MAG: hypothetical protein M3409_02060 [Gemmatimonadota bacterium]|nr:hypothetical protein [Gemmatimonadota bacterium]
MKIRALLSLGAAFFALAGCSEPITPAFAPESAPAALASTGGIDLAGVLEFAALPDLSGARHAEAYIRAAEGGVVELNGFRVEIPAGALPADTLVTIDLPRNAVLGKRVIAEFGPHAVQFSTPVKITFPLEGVLLPSTGGVGVARWENGAWTPLGGSVSDDGSSLSSTTPHFSAYGGHVTAGG